MTTLWPAYGGKVVPFHETRRGRQAAADSEVRNSATGKSRPFRPTKLCHSLTRPSATQTWRWPGYGSSSAHGGARHGARRLTGWPRTRKMAVSQVTDPRFSSPYDPNQFQTQLPGVSHFYRGTLEGADALWTCAIHRSGAFLRCILLPARCPTSFLPCDAMRTRSAPFAASVFGVWIFSPQAEFSALSSWRSPGSG